MFFDLGITIRKSVQVEGPRAPAVKPEPVTPLSPTPLLPHSLSLADLTRVRAAPLVGWVKGMNDICRGDGAPERKREREREKRSYQTNTASGKAQHDSESYTPTLRLATWHALAGTWELCKIQSISSSRPL